MLHQKRVLACVDRSRYAGSIADYAAWSALRLSLPLEFLHVIDRHPETASTKDRSGAIGIGSQESLLSTLTSEDEARSKAWRDDGRNLLNTMRERAKAAGVEAPDVRQRYGHLNEALSDLESEVHLYVLGRRGESAEGTQRDLGRSIEGVVRSLHHPILAVGGEFREPRRVMIAFDGSKAAQRCVAVVASSLLFKGLAVHLIMVVQKVTEARDGLESARAALEAAGFEATAQVLAGDPERTIARSLKDQCIDILVMGAYNHSRIRGLLRGSRTSDLLRAATVPVLLIR